MPRPCGVVPHVRGYPGDQLNSPSDATPQGRGVDSQKRRCGSRDRETARRKGVASE